MFNYSLTGSLGFSHGCSLCLRMLLTLLSSLFFFRLLLPSKYWQDMYTYIQVLLKGYHLHYKSRRKYHTVFPMPGVCSLMNGIAVTKKAARDGSLTALNYKEFNWLFFFLSNVLPFPFFHFNSFFSKLY